MCSFSPESYGFPCKLDAPPNTVVGRSYTHYRTPTGMVDVPVNLSAAIIRAMIPDTAEPSGFRVVDGAGNADGTFTISPPLDARLVLVPYDERLLAVIVQAGPEDLESAWLEAVAILEPSELS